LWCGHHLSSSHTHTHTHAHTHTRIFYRCEGGQQRILPSLSQGYGALTPLPWHRTQNADCRCVLVCLIFFSSLYIPLIGQFVFDHTELHLEWCAATHYVLSAVNSQRQERPLTCLFVCALIHCDSWNEDAAGAFFDSTVHKLHSLIVCCCGSVEETTHNAYPLLYPCCYWFRTSLCQQVVMALTPAFWGAWNWATGWWSIISTQALPLQGSVMRSYVLHKTAAYFFAIRAITPQLHPFLLKTLQPSANSVHYMLNTTSQWHFICMHVGRCMLCCRMMRLKFNDLRRDLRNLHRNSDRFCSVLCLALCCLRTCFPFSAECAAKWWDCNLPILKGHEPQNLHRISDCCHSSPSPLPL